MAIEFENISKQYRLGLVSTRTLSHDLNRWWKTSVLGKEDPYLKIGEVNDRASKGDSDYVWALRNIDFKVEQGDVLGIIGKNGAGKSTLLKILSKVTAPTTGTIRARGRIASLLEVGTGFHPEMTGRENIFMNGAIMGMTKAEISRKLDEIVDFAGVERYIDTPVKRYSSGMTVRLGFAIAAHLEPEILVVDEVLAVGDAEFQKKAIGKMQDVSKGEGRTVLFVSHNMFSVKTLCTSGLLLKDGRIDYMDTIEKVVVKYERDNQHVSAVLIEDRKDREGNGQLQLRTCYVKNGADIIVEDIAVGDKLTFEFELIRNGFDFNKNKVEVAINICDLSGKKILQISNLFLDQYLEIDSTLSKFSYEISKLSLAPGMYYCRFYIADGVNVLDWIDQVCFFNVISGDFYKTGVIDNSSVFFTEFEIRE